MCREFRVVLDFFALESVCAGSEYKKDVPIEPLGLTLENFKRLVSEPMHAADDVWIQTYYSVEELEQAISAAPNFGVVFNCLGLRGSLGAR